MSQDILSTEDKVKNLRAKRAAIIVLDGWGVAEAYHHNAINHAPTPYLDSLNANYPSGVVDANGAAVGLPVGQLSGSEVGHMTIGAGRAIYQDVMAINIAIADGSFDTNPAFLSAMDHVVKHQGALHLAGLLSDAGIHSTVDHLYALMSLAKKQGVTKVAIHAFLDGRDTPPQSAANFLRQLSGEINKLGLGQIASVCGRAIAMDRNLAWDKTEAAYNLLTAGIGAEAENSQICLDSNYTQEITDEFIPPTKLNDFIPVASGDAIIFFNFRSDRMRQLTRLFVAPETIEGLSRAYQPIQNLRLVTMTEYDESLNQIPIAFTKDKVMDNLGEVLAREGKTQLRAAESEKYPHVTFFFNGGREQPYVGEERIVIPSPKVASYSECPAMSAVELTDAVMAKIESNKPDVLIMNYANADMVGHTGSFEAAKTAVITVDQQLSRLVPFLLQLDYAILITADHGNAEEMYDEMNTTNHTAHTFNHVPGIVILPESSAKFGEYRLNPEATLADFAPTVLQLLNLPVPAAMKGKHLLQVKETAN